MKDKKRYKYIPQLITAIFEQQKESTVTLKQTCLNLPTDHPMNIQATIAHTQPGDTADIVKNK